MAEILLPPLRAVVELHRLSIERFGGGPGIRDAGGIEAALARAEQLIAYGDAVGVHAVAAAVGVSLCKNRHPFVDGNKRAGLFTMFVILRLNGVYLDAREVDATEMVLGIADGSRSEPDLVTFLQASSRILP
jgi:death on curing protein